MSSSESDTEEQSFQIQKSRKRSSKKQVSQKKQVSKEKKKGAKKEKEKKQMKKKKPSKSKAKGGGNCQADYQRVKQYMQKMNRPYSLINVYDNLHGEIKKSVLEQILEALAKQQFLVKKEYGKSIVYFLNQANFEINDSQIEQIGRKLNEARQLNAQALDLNKSLQQQYKRLQSMKTKEQLQREIEELKEKMEVLENKKKRLMSEVEQKIDEAMVLKEQKQEGRLKKELKKYRNLKKTFLSQMCENLQKKLPQVAEIVGVEL